MTAFRERMWDGRFTKRGGNALRGLWWRGRVRGPSTSPTDSLCESVGYAQDDRGFFDSRDGKALLVSREIVVKRQNRGWRGYVMANEGEIFVQTMSLLGMLYDIMEL